jgi:two-component system cell cycle response regulator
VSRPRRTRGRGRPTLPDVHGAAWPFPKGAVQPVLVVLTGPQVGQRIRLEQSALIGRDPESDLMLVDESVAWHHARVEPRNQVWVLVDLGEAQRTEINGMRVTEHPLGADDQIMVGGTVIRFELHDPIEQAYDDAVLERLNKDELTGLLARRKFDSQLLSALLAAARKGQPLAVILLDIDSLKAVNDRFGHTVGAGVISQVGAIIGNVVGVRGLACRLGGDEFGIALPGHDGSAAREVAEAVRAGIAAHAFAHDGHALDVRISCGIAWFPEHGHAPLELLRAADESLYKAKRGGGDRVELRP